MSLLRKAVIAAMLGLVLMTGCGPRETSADGSSSNTSTASPSSSSSSAHPTPLAPVPGEAGKSITVSNATFKLPKTWQQLQSDPNTGFFSEQRRCKEIEKETMKLPLNGCAVVTMSSYTRIALAFPDGTPIEKIIDAQTCGIMKHGAKLAAEPPKRMDDVEVGGEKAEYYEQVVCSQEIYRSLGFSEEKPTKAYTWIVRGQNFMVRATDVPGVDLDLDTLQSVLDNVNWQ